MNQESNPNGPTPDETLHGGADLIVSKRDGTSETVRIRQLSVGEFPMLLTAQDDEAKAAALYTARTVEWFGGLTLESQEALVIEGDRINADFFGRWFQRRLARQERLMPGVTDRILGVAVSAPAAPANTSPSRNTAPPSVRSPA
jgi:hypothetical protein